MRHTRNRQIAKAMKDNSWFEIKNNKIGGKENNCSELDQTFKWHRECYPWGHNYVEFEKEVAVPPGKIEKRAILRKAK